MAQGRLSFPGLYKINRGTVSVGHGITPSAFTVTVAPQPQAPQEVGDLVLTYGRFSRTFKECKIDQVTFSRDGANLLAVTLLDRRWKWAFGSISGHYNIRNPDGTIQGYLNERDRRAVSNTMRTPQELAILCLEAMGEKRYDVGDLPNDARPSVEWEADNPAAALADLCEQLGCRVILQLDDSVAIRRLNTGGNLPNIPTLHRREQTIDPAELPDEVRLVCAASYYQADLLLDALAEEPDGSLVALDDVSYKPTGGWSIADVPEFNGIQDQTLRALAKRSVFRYFRPRMPAQIPGYGTVESVDQLLPLNDVQVDAVDVAGRMEPKPSIVFGVWTSEGGSSENQAAELTPIRSDQDETVLTDFSIDPERGLIITGDYVYKLEGQVPNLTLAAPELVFRSACTVREPETFAYLRYERVLPNRGRRFGTGPKIIKHDEIRLTHRCDYLAGRDGTFSPGPITTNKKEVNAEADYYLNEEAKNLTTTLVETLTYSGIYPIELDGTIQRVTYNIGAPFASTTVERGRDPGNRDAIPYRLARALERMKAAQDLQRKLEPRRLRERQRRAGGK